MSHGTEFHGRGTAPAHPGRHRRGGAESWTPPLPQHRPVRHHAAGQAPADPPMTGSPLMRSHPTGQAPADPPMPGSHPFRGYSTGQAPADLPVSDSRLRRGYPTGQAPADRPMPGPFSLRGHDIGPTPADLPTPSFGRGYPPEQTPADLPMTGPFPLRGHDIGPTPADLPTPSFGRGYPPEQTPADLPMPASRPRRRYPTGQAPADLPMTGSLPLPQPSLPWLPQPSQPSLPQPRDRRPAPPLFPAAHGSLPLDAFEDDDIESNPAEAPHEAPVAESRADQAARRTRVSLAAPAPRCVDLDEDDVRIYSAPPIDGLGGFTIGSVPASVTPPKTWRKAAWFATGASGAVVVGLLCAGSFLVGKPPMDQAVQGAWPGYQGAPTIADPTGEHRPPTEGGSAAGPETASRPGSTAGKPPADGGAGPVDGVPTPPAGSTAAPEPATTGPAAAAAPSGPPRKPPVTPAQRETPVKPPWWYSFPPDAQTMGDNSEKFFNTVTTDPAAASSVTTGGLHDQGSQALARRYAGIAYFEVKKVSIDQQRGVTVNTVEVTHTDGTKTIEERTLTFGDGDKIAADGQ